jgi:oligoendopeptidase F
MAATLRAHGEIPQRYTWNAESVFATAAEWEAELAAAGSDLSQAARTTGRCADGLAAAAVALEARDRAVQRAATLMVYAEMSAAVDTTDQAALAMLGRARGLYGRTLAAFSSIEPEILRIGPRTMAEWQAKEPRLAARAHYLEDLFRKQEHVRSADVEEMLGLLADPFAGAANIASMLADADFTFVPAAAQDGTAHTLTQSTHVKLLSEPDRELRRTAWEHYADEYLAHRNGMASTLVTSVKQHVFRMRARRHPSTLSMALFDDNLPQSVFDNLLAVFTRNLPTWHRYWRLRRAALGIETLRTYDVWAPLSARPPRVPFEQAVDWICAGLAPMGDEYVQAIRRGCLEERWVDVYPNRGKSAGAFSTGVKGTHPFIMMSYDDTLESVSTLAHELGHSMHSYLSQAHQPFLSSAYSMFVAEVASNFHQAMVRGHLLSTETDPDFQLALIDEAMSNFHRYFFIMPTLARFEREIHERIERDEGVSSDVLIGLMGDLLSEGYGGEVSLDRERDGIMWAEFGHLYVDYYVFQYATGISGANALAQGVRSGGAHAAANYLRFLQSGSSVYALDALKIAGVDLSTPAPVEAGFEVLAGLVDRLEGIVGGRGRSRS